ncbi:hypothetical protein DMUE_4316 [Dictyocoela muelleri]|nr:hypothetical protein DMUE_4316 [Dictyocoela muelleri]
MHEYNRKIIKKIAYNGLKGYLFGGMVGMFVSPSQRFNCTFKTMHRTGLTFMTVNMAYTATDELLDRFNNLKNSSKDKKSFKGNSFKGNSSKGNNSKGNNSKGNNSKGNDNDYSSKGNNFNDNDYSHINQIVASFVAGGVGLAKGGFKKSIFGATTFTLYNSISSLFN